MRPAHDRQKAECPPAFSPVAHILGQREQPICDRWKPGDGGHPIEHVARALDISRDFPMPKADCEWCWRAIARTLERIFP